MAGPTRISQLTDGAPVQETDQIPVARGSGASGYTYKVNAGRLVSDLLNVTNSPSVNLSFDSSTRTLSADVDASVNVVDSPTIDLNWNASTRTLSADVIDSSITNAKIAFDGGSFCFRNKIINGNFDVWQRGTTFTGIGAGVFTADRWTTSTATVTLNKNIERQPVSVSDLPYTQAGLAYCVRASYTSGTNSTELALSQPIELLRTGSAGPFKVGQTYTLSYYARCQSNNTINWGIQSRDSSATILNALNIAGASQAITTSWARYSHTFTMVNPNPTNTFVGVFFTNSTTPANTYIDITGVQLEEGPTATPFEHRPIGTELALCQRYYEYAGNYIDNNTGVADGVWRLIYHYQVAKRTATPTLTWTAGAPPSTSPGFNAGTNQYWCLISVSIGAGLNEYGVLFTIDAEL